MSGSGERLWTANFILLISSTFLVTTAFYFLMPTLPLFAVDQLGANHKEVGYIIGFYTLAALLIRPISGLAVDLLGRKVLYILAMFLFAALFAGYPLITAIIPLLVLRFIHGITWGSSTSTAFTILVDIVPFSKRARGMGYFGLGFNAAMALGPMIGLWIMGPDRYGLLFYGATIVAFMGLALVFGIRFKPFVKPSGLKFGWKALIAKPALPVTLAVLVTMSTFGSIVTFIAIFAKEMGLSEHISIFFMVMAFGMGLSRVFAGQIFDRFGPKWVALSGMLSASSGFLILASTQNVSLFLTGAGFIGLGFGILMPTLQTMANNVVRKERRGVANSTFLTGLDLGIGLGSVLSGIISDMFSLQVVYYWSSIVILTGALIFWKYALPHYEENKLAE